MAYLKISKYVTNFGIHYDTLTRRFNLEINKNGTPRLITPYLNVYHFIFYNS